MNERISKYVYPLPADVASDAGDSLASMVAHERGMSLRQHYAGLAMQGMLVGQPGAILTHVAASAFRLADIMLEQERAAMRAGDAAVEKQVYDGE